MLIFVLMMKNKVGRAPVLWHSATHLCCKLGGGGGGKLCG